MQGALSEQPENIQSLRTPGPEIPVGVSLLEKLKTNWSIVLGALGSIALFAAIIYAAYSYGRRGQEVQPVPSPTIVTTRFPTQVLTLPPTPIETPTIHPSPAESFTPTPTPEDLPTETINYSPKTDWLTYTDNIANFKIQYPPSHKISEQVEEGSYVYFLNCGSTDPNTGKALCWSGFNVRVYNDYDQGSRRVWLDNKYLLDQPYYQNFIIDEKKALVAIVGNMGGSCGGGVAIPKDSMMVVVWNDGLCWDPDTKKLPDLTHFKETLSTFKFLD